MRLAPGGFRSEKYGGEGSREHSSPNGLAGRKERAMKGWAKNPAGERGKAEGLKAEQRPLTHRPSGRGSRLFLGERARC